VAPGLSRSSLSFMTLLLAGRMRRNERPIPADHGSDAGNSTVASP
jgi:hypothetical protein